MSRQSGSPARQRLPASGPRARPSGSPPKLANRADPARRVPTSSCHWRFCQRLALVWPSIIVSAYGAGRSSPPRGLCVASRGQTVRVAHAQCLWCERIQRERPTMSGTTGGGGGAPSAYLVLDPKRKERPAVGQPSDDAAARTRRHLARPYEPPPPASPKRRTTLPSSVSNGAQGPRWGQNRPRCAWQRTSKSPKENLTSALWLDAFTWCSSTSHRLRTVS